MRGQLTHEINIKYKFKNNGSRRCGTWSLPYTSQVQVIDVLPSWTYLIVSQTYGAESVAKRKIQRGKKHCLLAHLIAKIELH